MKTNVDEIFLNDKNYKRVTVDRDILWQGTNKQFQLPSRASSFLHTKSFLLQFKIETMRRWHTISIPWLFS